MFRKDDIDFHSIDQTVRSAVCLSWENVTVRADRESDFFGKNIVKKIFRVPVVKDEPHKILSSVTGHANGGSLVAIMGPSGAGKTTLLAALARRIELTSGCIRVNGCSMSRTEMATIAGYLPQFDALPSGLTAMEYMLFTCVLRLDKRTSSKERNSLAANIFAQLGLLESSDTFISRLSGGEIKRLSLAVELVTKPKILFLDEPTSGLDTCTAMRVIESARAQAMNGTLVFCSIHQPAMDLYEMFSHMILLSNGTTAYYGTLENATKFFNSKGFNCPESFNEAEYYVKLVSNGNLVDSLNATQSFLVSQYSTEDRSSSFLRPKSKTSTILDRHGSSKPKSQICKPNQFVQFYWISWRILLEMRRTMFKEKKNLIAFMVSSLLICMFFYGVNSRTQSGIQDIRGALYMITSEVIYRTCYSVVYVLPGEMPLYLRENSMYNPAPYYTATIMIGLIPKAVLHTVAFLTAMFLTLEVTPDFFTYIQFAICVIAATIASSAYGIVFSSWFENPVIATTVMGPIDLISFLMAGMFYNIRSMPAYLSWMKYLSIFFYTNEALAIVHWKTVDFIECYPDKNLPCLKNGREVLAEYGYNESNFWLDTSGLLLLALGMHLMGYLGVKRRRAVKAMY